MAEAKDDDDKDPKKVGEEEGKGEETSSEDGDLASRESESQDDSDEDQSLTEEEREILRQHRRQERRESKQRRREAIARKDRYISQLERQVHELSGRMEQMESRSSGQDIVRLDQAIETAAQKMELSRSAKLSARQANDTDVEMEADEALYNARRELEELSHLKRRIQEGQRSRVARRQTGTPAALNPQLVSKASAWARKNDWFSVDSSDEDSEITRVVDKRMVDEGWDPTTDEYWEELDERLAKRLPHRYNVKGRGEEQTSGRDKQRGNHQITGGAGGESPGGKDGYRLSKERIDALKEAGMWDDTKQRARMIKRYQEQDKELTARR